MNLVTRLKRSVIFVLTLGVFGCASDNQNEPQAKYLVSDVAFVNGHVFNAEDGFVDYVFIVREGAVIANVKNLTSDFSGKIVDLAGKWVIPGLIDMHTHSYGNFIPNAKNDSPGTEVIAQRILKAGVTGFVDLFGYEKKLFEVRAKQRSGAFVGADMYTSLTCFTAPKGHCSEYGIPTRTVTTVEEAKSQIDDLAQYKPDVIKIVYQPTDDQPSISKEVFAQLVKSADEFGIKTIVHIKTWQDVRDAVEVGASAVTHVPRGKIPLDVPVLMAQSGMVMIPTLAVHNDFVNFLFDESVLDAPLLKQLVPESFIAAYKSQSLLEKYKDRKAEFEARNRIAFAAVKAIHKAGVRVLVGTDAGNWNTVQGYSVHREMKLLSEAGFTPEEAIAAASTYSAEFLGIKVGTNEGERANFVVLNTSPTKNILNTQDIAFVVKDGKVVVPKE
ncbi:amidohydrolase family protein [Pseudoalteromonas xiamenensis]